jgi:hypothetical protein
VAGRPRRRINGCAATVRRCDERITARRGDLERALRSVDEVAAAGSAGEAPDRATRLAVELDALGRIQSRIDSWLRIAVGAVSDHPAPVPFAEGPA